MIPNQRPRKQWQSRHRRRRPATRAENNPAQPNSTTYPVADPGLVPSRNAPQAPQSHTPPSLYGLTRNDPACIALMNAVNGVDREQALWTCKDFGIDIKLPTLEKVVPGGFIMEEADIDNPYTRLASVKDTVNWQAQLDAPERHSNTTRPRLVAKVDKRDYQAVQRLTNSMYYWGLGQPGDFLNVVVDPVTWQESRAELHLVESFRAKLVIATEDRAEDRVENPRPAKRRRDEAHVPAQGQHGSSHYQPAANATSRDAGPPRENIARVKQEDSESVGPNVIPPMETQLGASHVVHYALTKALKESVPQVWRCAKIKGFGETRYFTRLLLSNEPTFGKVPPESKTVAKHAEEDADDGKKIKQEGSDDAGTTDATAPRDSATHGAYRQGFDVNYDGTFTHYALFTEVSTIHPELAPDAATMGRARREARDYLDGKIHQNTVFDDDNVWVQEWRHLFSKAKQVQAEELELWQRIADHKARLAAKKEAASSVTMTEDAKIPLPKLEDDGL